MIKSVILLLVVVFSVIYFSRSPVNGFTPHARRLTSSCLQQRINRGYAAALEENRVNLGRLSRRPDVAVICVNLCKKEKHGASCVCLIKALERSAAAAAAAEAGGQLGPPAPRGLRVELRAAESQTNLL